MSAPAVCLCVATVAAEVKVTRDFPGRGALPWCVEPRLSWKARISFS